VVSPAMASVAEKQTHARTIARRESMYLTAPPKTDALRGARAKGSRREVEWALVVLLLRPVESRVCTFTATRSERDSLARELNS
jgi:hypothetical protein